MTHEEMRRIARGVIEQNIDTGDYETLDALYNDALCHARLALHKAGVSLSDAQSVAKEVAQEFAQP